MSEIHVEFKSKKKEVLQEFEKKLERALQDVGKEAVSLTHRDKDSGGTPVDTGRLRNSISYATNERQNYDFSYTDDDGKQFSDSAGGGVSEHTVIIGTNVEYAEKIEEGSLARGGEEGSLARGGAHMLRNAINDIAQDRAKKIIKASLDAE